jgi:flagellar biosynthesis/type III secretory pathway M-ring protein FliF/YscJ
MDSLQLVLQPVLRVWRGLSNIQRIGLGVVAAALLGLLIIVSTVGHGPDSAIAFSGLSTDDEAAVVLKLKDAKIPYELVDGGHVVDAARQLGFEGALVVHVLGELGLAKRWLSEQL